jgi:hypothetical protein
MAKAKKTPTTKRPPAGKKTSGGKKGQGKGATPPRPATGKEP